MLYIKFDLLLFKYKFINNICVNNVFWLFFIYFGFFCGFVKGNVGNRLFVFVFIYGIVKMKNIFYIILKNDVLLSVFNFFNDIIL